MRGDSPRTKFVFTRVPRPTMCNGQLGGGNPLGGELEIAKSAETGNKRGSSLGAPPGELGQ